jgi:hypothetical protein
MAALRIGCTLVRSTWRQNVLPFAAALTSDGCAATQQTLTSPEYGLSGPGDPTIE